MYNFKLTLQYDGGRYKGWQRLGNEDNTIQGKLETVLSQMLGEATELTGCSRTDAGVHALAQIANFKTTKRLSQEEILGYLNRYLPQDISVIKVEEVAPDFHSRYHAKSKTYLYRIWNKEYPNPFMRKYSMHITDRLDTDQMRNASSHFIGQHDFTAYSNAKSKKKSMVRQINSIHIEEAEGFLHNMVRRIVGTLIEVGLGKLAAEEIPEIILSQERNRTGNMAEACGLYLEKIEYDGE